MQSLSAADLLYTGIFGLAIQPLVGTAVRIRANYTPKGFQLGDGGSTREGPGYLAMLKKVHRVEVS